jgi:hypothetical protein
MTGRAPGKPMSVPHNRLAPKASSRATAKRLRRGAQARRTPKKRTKRLDIREQAELSRVRELEEAEAEWAQRGYPKIRWRRLSPRLQIFSPALRPKSLCPLPPPKSLWPLPLSLPLPQNLGAPSAHCLSRAIMLF